MISCAKCENDVECLHVCVFIYMVQVLVSETFVKDVKEGHKVIAKKCQNLMCEWVGSRK